MEEEIIREDLQKSLLRFAKYVHGMYDPIVEASGVVVERHPMIDHLVEQAKILRRAAQKAGISDSHIGWDELPDYRKNRWLDLSAKLTIDEHYVLVKYEYLRTLRMLASADESIRSYDDFKEADEAINKILG